MPPREPISFAEPDPKNGERFQANDSQSVPGAIQVEFVPGYAPMSGVDGEAVDSVTSLLLSAGFRSRYSREFTLRDRGEDTKAILSPPRRNIWLLTVAENANTQVISEELRSMPQVVDAAPQPLAHPASPFDEELLGSSDAPVVIRDNLLSQWYIYRCGIDKVWKEDKLSGQGVIIVDIDWGFLVTHEDLKEKIGTGLTYNSFDHSVDVDAGSHVYHGTAVAGLAVAPDNDVGMAGIAYGATLWAIQANHGKAKRFAANAWVEAIDWVRTKQTPGKRKIIVLEAQTNQLRNYEEDMDINEAIREAVAENIVVCVPAGNGAKNAGRNIRGDKIAESGSILVAATERNGRYNRRAVASNYSRERITVSAPGSPIEDVTCSNAMPLKYTNRFGGTSGAAAKVAGVVALMLEANNTLSCEQINKILRGGAPVDTESDRPLSGGFLDAKRAVDEANKLRPRFELFASSRTNGTFRLDRSESESCGQLVPVGADIVSPVGTVQPSGDAVFFATGRNDRTLYHATKAATGEWSGWRAVGAAAESLTIAKRLCAGFDVFATSGTRLWHMEGQAPDQWTDIAVALSAVTSLVDSDRGLRVFGFDEKGRVQEISRLDGTFGEWHPIHGESDPVDGLRAVSNLDHRAELFATRPDGSLVHNWETSAHSWSGWQRLTDRTNGFSVVRDYLGRLNVFSIDAAANVQHAAQVCPNSDQWTEWTSVGVTAEEIAGALNADGKIELFGRTPSGIVHAVQAVDGEWTVHQSAQAPVDRLEVVQVL